MKQYDVAIIGAGMAGATLALAIHQLCEGKLKIAVVEANQMDGSALHPGFDSRAIALSFGTSNILKQLNLWPDFLPFLTPITDIEVSDKGHCGLADIKAESQGVEALGYVVELENVGRIYQQKLMQCPSIDYFCPNTIKTIKRTLDDVVVTLDDDSQFSAKLLVAADGALSESCQQLGIPLTEIDFEQFAVIVNVSTEQLPQGRAFERFTSSGPLAFLPMSEGRSSVVWCVSEQRSRQLMATSDHEIITQLQQDFGWRLGKITRVGARGCYPLLLRYRESVVSHRSVVIGNAAQTLHPIAGQGFNLGIRDVISLAEEIQKAHKVCGDIGDYSVLSQYRQRRDHDRNSTMSLTSSLVNCFSNDLLAMRIGRNLGLLAMNYLPYIKQPIVKQTMGLVER
ncbi:2-octaprenyl-6-methoxyphenyl hydroxylase [Vibrio rumoiensis]|uniref:2-octaprenyl-6-methoxyphenyl hydroxylase n=1 Tax=Vibrio rumoiensis 1S-45 TaxID=1188252 RepID=A0A1E5E4L0_9VIBR|nr:2-octaprenyl-6-methoxyphenyl hydroxylase [Vibrio rumoiensis]OEF27771.1 2-octaprenyl-6-methoxyphenyl hydroxylase [Vibrio rumoiensis 1S-45]